MQPGMLLCSSSIAAGEKIMSSIVAESTAATAKLKDTVVIECGGKIEGGAW